MTTKYLRSIGAVEAVKAARNEDNSALIQLAGFKNYNNVDVQYNGHDGTHHEFVVDGYDDWDTYASIIVRVEDAIYGDAL